MKQAEVQIGETYLAKVSHRLCRVRIQDELPTRSGKPWWLAKNLETGREITIRSAQRLRPLPQVKTAAQVLDAQTRQLANKMRDEGIRGGVTEATMKQLEQFAPVEGARAVGETAGVVVSENGRAVTPGVVCKCDDPSSSFCPMHGRKPALPTDIHREAILNVLRARKSAGFGLIARIILKDDWSEESIQRFSEMMRQLVAEGRIEPTLNATYKLTASQVERDKLPNHEDVM